MEIKKGNLSEMVTHEDNITRDLNYNWDSRVWYTGYTNYCAHQKPSV